MPGISTGATFPPHAHAGATLRNQRKGPFRQRGVRTNPTPVHQWLRAEQPRALTKRAQRETQVVVLLGGSGAISVSSLVQHVAHFDFASRATHQQINVPTHHSTTSTFSCSNCLRKRGRVTRRQAQDSPAYLRETSNLPLFNCRELSHLIAPRSCANVKFFFPHRRFDCGSAESNVGT